MEIDGNDNDGENPRNPTRYRATSINYHAHLLGSEMYATLLREGDEEQQEQEVVASFRSQNQADLSTTTTTTTTTTSAANTIVKDLKSSEFWNFDYQTSTAMDKEYEIQVGTSTTTGTTSDGNEGIELVTGVEIKAGDKIQATCVYNSMYREDKTRFGLTTYDEMCIITLQVTFKTPPVVVDAISGAVSGIAFSADLNLRAFSCELMDDSTNDDNNEDSSSTSSSTSPVVLSDIWQGTLDINEDPRNIWEDHPITATDMCTFFPVVDFVLFDSFLPMEARNCPPTITDGNDNNGYDHDSSSICYGFETDNGNGNGSGKVEFLDDIIAGYTCEGGTYNEQDSNEAPSYVTEENCLVDGGGTSYDAYTCEEIEDWLRTEVIWSGLTDQVIEYMKGTWWQPTCCREVVEVVSIGDEDEDGGDTAAGDTATVSVTVTATATATAEEESSSSTYSSAYGFVIVASFFITMMAL